MSWWSKMPAETYTRSRFKPLLPQRPCAKRLNPTCVHARIHHIRANHQKLTVFKEKLLVPPYKSRLYSTKFSDGTFAFFDHYIVRAPNNQAFSRWVAGC